MHFSRHIKKWLHLTAVMPAWMTIFLVGGFFLLSFGTRHATDEILSEHISLYDLQSSANQRLGYICLLLILACLILFALLGAAFSTRETISFLRFDHVIMMGAVFALTFGAKERLNMAGILLAWLSWPIGKLISKHSLASSTPIQHIKRIVESKVVAASLVLIALALLWCMPLASPLVISSLTELRWVESHYAATVLPGFDMVSGRSTGTIERANYGVGMPVLVAACLFTGQLFGAQEMGLVTVVKIYQLIAIVLIGAIILLQNRRYGYHIFLLVIAASSFTLSGMGMAIGIPNQSGVRYVPILAGILCFAFELRRKQPRVYVLGIIAGAVTAFSPETGLALTAGLLAASILCRFNVRSRVWSLYSSLLSFCMPYVCVFVLLSLTVARPILPGLWNNGLEFLAIYGSGGYGGLVDRLSINAAMFFMLAGCTLVHLTIQVAAGQRLLPQQVWQAGIATTMLIWIYYYVNRMAEWNLWFEWVLLALMISPSLVRIIPTGASEQNWITGGFSRTMVIYALCLLCGQICYSSWHTVGGFRKWLTSQANCRDASNFVRDMYIEGWHSSSLPRQFRVLRRYKSVRPIVLCGFPRHVYRMGFNEGFPWYDVPTEVVFKRDLHVVGEWLDRHGPEYILAEGPESTTALVAPQHTQQIWLHLAYLRNYAEAFRHDGWVVFRRASANETQPNFAVYTEPAYNPANKNVPR